MVQFIHLIIPGKIPESERINVFSMEFNSLYETRALIMNQLISNVRILDEAYSLIPLSPTQSLPQPLFSSPSTHITNNRMGMVEKRKSLSDLRRKVDEKGVILERKVANSVHSIATWISNQSMKLMKSESEQRLEDIDNDDNVISCDNDDDDNAFVVRSATNQSCGVFVKCATDESCDVHESCLVADTSGHKKRRIDRIKVESGVEPKYPRRSMRVMYEKAQVQVKKENTRMFEQAISFLNEMKDKNERI